MLQVSYIRDNTQDVKSRLGVKNFAQIELIDTVLLKDEQRRANQKELDDSLAELNTIAKTIGNFYKTGQQQEAESLKQKTVVLKEQAKQLENRLHVLLQEIEDILVLIPNIPHIDVVAGRSSEDNEIVKSVGNSNHFSADLLPHWDISDKFGLIDFDNGAKITGSGFPVYRGKMAKFQRALIQYFLDKAVEAGYFEVQPPFLINQDSGFGTGQLPDKEGQMYHIELDNLYLIPTAEVPVTNLFRNMLMPHTDLPQKLTAYSACFRREAGSYGKDVRGLNRLHQFDKVEIVRIEQPEQSYKALEEMCSHVAGLLESLELPYRMLRLCGGDISFASSLTYDFEVFAAGQKRWLEVSSVSNFETFQSVRMKLRCKGLDGKTFIPHTLNGSALALPRIMAAILENNQTDEGVSIPTVLRSYTGFDILKN
jgi:seryl-tRNA synthetase